MNGVTETSGKVVEALKTQPLTLALIVIVAVFMWFVYSGVREQRSATHEIIKILLDKCGPQRTAETLVPPL
jgi:hypothetical protein